MIIVSIEEELLQEAIDNQVFMNQNKDYMITLEIFHLLNMINPKCKLNKIKLAKACCKKFQDQKRAHGGWMSFSIKLVR